jgi:hydroxymethylglutaryl-CoA lyase
LSKGGRGIQRREQKAVSDLPKFVHIYEQGPREGFQIESAMIKTADKIRLIDALSETGVQKMQITSFVSPKWVPQMGDAEEVCAGFTRRAGVSYTALALNEKGKERMRGWAHKLTMEDDASSFVWATNEFALRNNNRCQEMGIETGIDQEAMIECARMAEEIVGHVLPGNLYKALGLPRKGTKLHDTYNR